jgi:streptogramin lyase/DNA-directed RNA polymerase subunit RPC12/RpoP
MTQSFKCPSCGAPLSFNNAGATVHCPFCSNSVIVPEELRHRPIGPQGPQAAPFQNIIGQAARFGELGQLIRSGNKIGAIKLYRELFGSSLQEAKDAVERLERGQPVEVMHSSGGEYKNVQIDPAKFPAPVPQKIPIEEDKSAPLVLAVVLIGSIFLGVVIVIGLLISYVKTKPTSSYKPSSGDYKRYEPSKPQGYATVALEFGSDGIGPGQFKDARSIGVDGDGRIYVAEYLGGRVQVFDAQGKYVAEWTVDPKMPLRGMAVDRKGIVYIAQHGAITRYEGITGKSLGEIRSPGSSNFDDVVATQDGGFLAASVSAASDDIVRFNSSGQPVQTIRKAISSQTDRSELDMRLAADGLGNIYALGSFNNAVFKFTREGRFVTRIGGEGSEPGQFRGLDALAVDGQGRIFVSDIKGIQVFDTDGRYLDVFKVPNNVASGLVFNDRNELFAAARNRVVKFTIRK